jgi:hypothetical protein
MITTDDEEIAAQIEEYGIIGFYSTYGKHNVAIDISGDATIYDVGAAFKAFLLATGFPPGTIAEILDLPE